MAAAIPAIVAVVGTAVSAYGQKQAGEAQKRAARIEARSLERVAGTRIATSQRAGMEAERQGRLQASRALAVASASGGGASDPTVVNLMAQLAGETNYRKMVALYEGQEESRALIEEAAATREGGRTAASAANLAATGTVLSGASSIYAKYGMNS